MIWEVIGSTEMLSNLIPQLVGAALGWKPRQSGFESVLLASMRQQREDTHSCTAWDLELALSMALG